MVTTRSQSLSSRIQCATLTMITKGPVTRSQTASSRGIVSKPARKNTMSPYATRSKRMNTRSNAKRFIELTEREDSGRMTRSMTTFVKKYSDYTGVKTRSMTKCM